MSELTCVDQLFSELMLISESRHKIHKLDFCRVTLDRRSMLESLAVVIKNGGLRAKIPQRFFLILNLGKQCLFIHQDEFTRKSAAKVIGYACELLGVEITEIV